MRLRLLLALALVALPLASFQAAAQGTPTMTITVTGPPTASVNAGQPHQASFQVAVQASGFQCTQAGQIDIAVALSNAGGAPPGVTPTVDPPMLSFAVPPGVYGSPLPPEVPVPVGEPLNESGQVTLRIVTTAEAGGVFPATIAATYAGGAAGQGCFPDLPATSGSANHQVTIVAQQDNATTPPPSTPGNMSGNNTGGQPPPSRGLPGFEPLVAFGALAVAVLARRRRD